MDHRRTLLVLRHAKTEDSRPGSKDGERRLTPDGERHALEVGEYLRIQGITVDTVLCSSAVRARRTASTACSRGTLYSISSKRTNRSEAKIR